MLACRHPSHHARPHTPPSPLARHTGADAEVVRLMLLCASNSQWFAKFGELPGCWAACCTHAGTAAAARQLMGWRRGQRPQRATRAPLCHLPAEPTHLPTSPTTTTNHRRRKRALPAVPGGGPRLHRGGGAAAAAGAGGGAGGAGVRPTPGPALRQARWQCGWRPGWPGAAAGALRRGASRSVPACNACLCLAGVCASASLPARLPPPGLLQRAGRGGVLAQHLR